MALRLVSGPAVEPVTLAEARQQLRLLATGSPAEHRDDAMVQRLISAARIHVDGNRGWLNRALITQTWELVLDAFPAKEIELPLPPLQGVTFVKYLDTAEVLQTIDPADYAVDTTSEPGWIAPGLSGWPATLHSINTVVIRFVAGYGDTAAAVPDPLRAGILLHVEALYDRDPKVSDLLMAEADRLLGNFRIGGVF